MAAPTLQKMFGGVVPGGIITITPGTPIQIISNLKLATGDAGIRKVADAALFGDLPPDRHFSRCLSERRGVCELWQLRRQRQPDGV